MKKTLNYFLKNRINIILILSFIVFLIVFFYLFNAEYVYTYEYYDQYDKIIIDTRLTNSPFPLLATITAILSTFVVVFEFYFKMRRVSVDQIYALPIKREKIFLSKLIICYLEVLIPITLGFILSFLMIVFKNNLFAMVYFIPYYFGLIFLSLVLITSFAFLYTRANTFFDGVVNMLSYACILPLIVSIIKQTFVISYSSFGDGSYFFIYSPITLYSSWMNDLFMNRTYKFQLATNLSFIIFILIGFISIYLFIKLNKEEPSENTTQISLSNFSYRTIIPLYSIVFVILSIMSGGILGLTFASIFTYLIFVLFRRSFKIEKKDYLFIILYIVIGIILGIVCEEIREVFLNTMKNINY